MFEALLVSPALLADSFFDADGLVTAALAVDGALDFSAPVLLLFSLTVLSPLVVVCNPGSYTISAPVAPQKNYTVQSLFWRSGLVVLSLVPAVAVVGLQPRTANNRMPEITIRVYENVIKTSEGKIGGRR